MVDDASKARMLFEAAEQLGWSNPAEIAKLVKRFERGLPAEDELCVIFHWLGKCLIVHKLDQLSYPPDAKNLYQIPDLLAVFEHNGTKRAILIEVKTSIKDKLSWRSDYFDSLQRYAALLNLPLIIAWKHSTFWVLFEPCHFRIAKTNYKISFTEAMRQNLLGILAGDFSFSFKSGTGLHMKIKKLSNTKDGFNGVVEQAYFQNPDGDRDNGGEGLMHLFMCIDQETSIKESDDMVTQSFVIENSNQAEFAHRAIVSLLSIFSKPANQLSWRQIMLQNQISSLPKDPKHSAKIALRKGYINKITNYRPSDVPYFLA